jgi:hypothetical protein
MGTVSARTIGPKHLLNASAIGNGSCCASIRGSLELGQRAPRLGDRKEWIVRPPDAQDRGPDARVHGVQAIDEAEVPSEPWKNPSLPVSRRRLPLEVIAGRERAHIIVSGGFPCSHPRRTPSRRRGCGQSGKVSKTVNSCVALRKRVSDRQIDAENAFF